MCTYIYCHILLILHINTASKHQTTSVLIVQMSALFQHAEPSALRNDGQPQYAMEIRVSSIDATLEGKLRPKINLPG